MTLANDSMPWDCLDLSIDIESISEAGRDFELKLTDDQIKSLCGALDIVNIQFRKAQFHLKPIANQRFILSGDMAYRVEQTCIVTLEAVSEEHSDRVNVQFWPEDAVARYYASQAEADFDPEGDIEPEQIEAGQVNVGRYLYEFLSTSINPYPRKDGAEFDWQEKSPVDSDDETMANKPFAALKVLKKNGKDGEEGK